MSADTHTFAVTPCLCGHPIQGEAPHATCSLSAVRANGQDLASPPGEPIAIKKVIEVFASDERRNQRLFERGKALHLGDLGIRRPIGTGIQGRGPERHLVLGGKGKDGVVAIVQALRLERDQREGGVSNVDIDGNNAL
jgi:hypothetical protein